MADHVLIIGAQRCGTSWLRTLLGEHRDVAIAEPLRPEPKFFLSDDAVELGEREYRRRHFSHAMAGQICVDKSTSYLEDPAAARRAAAVVPHARVLVQLRDPIERAVSNWRFSCVNGLEDRALVDALRQDLDGPRRAAPSHVSVSPFSYATRGRYSTYLKPWLTEFPGQVRVQFLEEVGHDPDTLSGLLRFVGLRTPVEAVSQRRAENTSPGSKPHLPEPLVHDLRQYFRESDDDLRLLLGRPLPWSDSA